MSLRRDLQEALERAERYEKWYGKINQELHDARAVIKSMLERLGIWEHYSLKPQGLFWNEQPDIAALKRDLEMDATFAEAPKRLGPLSKTVDKEGEADD